MKDIYRRAAKWNSLRYDREYNQDLTVALLREEYKEWLDAKMPTDKLDALCDIVFVCYGAIWKLNVENNALVAASNDSHMQMSALLSLDIVWPMYLTAAHLDVLEYDSDYPVLNSLHDVACVALTEMLGMGLTQEQCTEALRIVCDSNESKSIQKVEAAIKANISKGPYFIPPEPRLTRLLEACNGYN